MEYSLRWPTSSRVLRRPYGASLKCRHEAPALLAMLAEHGIHEGSEVSVGSPTSDERPGALVAGEELTLSLGAAQLIWVERI